MRNLQSFFRVCLLGILIAAGAAAPAQSARAEHMGRVLKFYAKEFVIMPSDTFVDAGPVRIMFFNEGTVAHAIAIEGMEEPLLAVPPGGIGQVTLKLKAGEYIFYCPKKGHREKGMVGRLKVHKEQR